MKKRKGTALAPGFADGTAFIYAPTKPAEIRRDEIGKADIEGEVAGEPALACLLVGMGIRHLSLNMGQAPVVGHYLRSLSLGDLESASRAALAARDLKSVQDAIQAIHQKVKPAG